MQKHRKGQELFQLIDRKLFARLVSKWGMDERVRKFTTWEMTCALLTALTIRLGSYREIEGSLGIPRATFSDAMIKRHSQFFNDLCDEILLEIRGRTKDRKLKRAIRQILALDATEIKVHGSLFSSPGWKQNHAHGRLAAAKMHVVWNVDGEWVDDFIVTGGKANDSRASRLFQLKAGYTYVFDRAYSDILFWRDIEKAGSDFVTRLRNVGAKTLALSREAEQKIENGVLYDGDYKPSIATRYRLPKEDHAITYRHIVYRDPLTKKLFHFVTSCRSLAAQEVADIYKQRWSVELLFRWLKGHLDIRYLAAKNKNAVKKQLAVAVLMQLLLQLKKIRERYQGTLWELLRSIRIASIRQSLALQPSPPGCRWNGLANSNLAPS